MDQLTGSRACNFLPFIWSQVALFVAPVLVLASLFLGPGPMCLAFPAGLVLTVLPRSDLFFLPSVSSH